MRCRLERNVAYMYDAYGRLLRKSLTFFFGGIRDAFLHIWPTELRYPASAPSLKKHYDRLDLGEIVSRLSRTVNRVAHRLTSHLDFEE